jgi:GTP-binding protein EngB required for normal cell division
MPRPTFRWSTHGFCTFDGRRRTEAQAVMSRRLRVLLGALAVAALLWLLFAAAERALALAQRFLGLPGWLQWTLGTVLVLFAAVGAALLWILLRPRRRRPAPAAPSREALAQRIERLHDQGVATGALAGELDELDRRRASARVYVAVFGEISAGKSSLIAALAPQAQVARDVRGGTTREVAHFDGPLADGRTLCLADVPGSREAGGEARETLAREEVLRAHAVLYVCQGDLTRSQAAELHWLADFGKPLLLVLNKADQWDAAERDALLARLRQHAGDMVDAVVAVSAGGSERFERILADGRSERVERQRAPQIEALRTALDALVAPGAASLETARERAVLAGLHERTGAAETQARGAEAERIVARYARRAVVGALAAVAPGSDLVIQGALATAMARALGRLYEVPVTELEIEAFLKQARMTLRTSISIVLAIAGNALKAFPGLGTLGGGVVHAFAYALIFDSLGKALAGTFAEHHALDQQAAGERLKALLVEGNSGRLKRLATLTVAALRDDS